jgi:hypothetical protein
MQVISTVAEAIDKLGGVRKTGEVVERRPEAVNNWRRTNKFPAETYVAILAALHVHGCTAPPSLWGMFQQGVPRKPRKPRTKRAHLEAAE